MEFTNEIYEQYIPMVNKYTSEIARNYGVSYKDLVGIAMERFCIAVDTYNPNKAKFTTYVYHMLKRLHQVAANILLDNKMCVYMYCDDTKAEPDELDYSLKDSWYYTEDTHEEKVSLMDSISTELSMEAQVYLKDLFAGDFTKVSTGKSGRPTKYSEGIVAKKYGWSLYKARSVQKEISTWWNSYENVI